MWLQQKMTTVANTDPRQGQMNQLMLWMMPMMFAFFTLSFPSGLALYWVVSNVIGIVIQYFASGWGGLATMFKPKQAPAEAAPVGAAAALPAEPKGADDGQRGSKRKNRRRRR